jgi:hypothetical protein
LQIGGFSAKLMGMQDVKNTIKSSSNGTNSSSHQPHTSSKTAKQQRLAGALRENLKRRKTAQQKAS